MSPEDPALAALSAGQITAQDLYREVLADRDRLLEEIRALRAQVAALKRGVALGQELVAVMEGQP